MHFWDVTLSSAAKSTGVSGKHIAYISGFKIIYNSALLAACFITL
jgi:hypothetical protein